MSTNFIEFLVDSQRRCIRLNRPQMLAVVRAQTNHPPQLGTRSLCLSAFEQFSVEGEPFQSDRAPAPRAD